MSSMTKKEYNQRYYQDHKEYFLKRSKEQRESDPEANNEYMRKYMRKYRVGMDQDLLRKRQREAAKRFRENHPERSIESVRNWQKANPEKKFAQDLVASKKIPKNDKCSKCGSEEFLVRHHPDYDKPLEVITLCQSCHCKHHRGIDRNE